MNQSIPSFAGALPPAFTWRAAKRSAVLTATLFLFGGCASFSPDGGFDAVADLTQQRIGQAPSWQRNVAEADAAAARTTDVLKQPLTADTAVEVALLNNRGLQASFGELGIAEADLVRAGRLANPSIGFTHLAGGGVTEIDRSFLFDVLGLLTLPSQSRIETQRFEQAQYQAAFEAVGLAAETRRAFYIAVASHDLVRYGEQVQSAADASSELARRMAEAGNFNKLAQMRQQAFLADATTQLARARHQAVADRERLVRLLGLSRDQLGFTLIERLPDLPARPVDPGDAEQTAMDKRLDIQMAKRSNEATARALGLGKASRFVNVLELGYADKRQTGAATQHGYQVELQLPLFDFGAVRNARAEAIYAQSMNRTAETAVNAGSEVRESYSAYRTSYELARHYRDDVVPLKKRISDENLLRYNGMLISVFDLLADARDQIAGVTAYVEALRDYWVADTNLQTAISGRSPAAASLSRPASDAAASAGH